VTFGFVHNTRTEQVVFDIVDMEYPYNAIVGVSDPGDPQPTSEFYVVCPCPDGLMQDETQGLSWFGLRRPYFQQREDEAYIILHRGACSRGYKLCERGNGSQVS
jgi:hypothetical protein